MDLYLNTLEILLHLMSASSFEGSSIASSNNEQWTGKFVPHPTKLHEIQQLQNTRWDLMSNESAGVWGEDIVASVTVHIPTFSFTQATKYFQMVL